jgi:hypothetical protein
LDLDRVAHRRSSVGWVDRSEPHHFFLSKQNLIIAATGAIEKEAHRAIISHTTGEMPIRLYYFPGRR